MRQVLLQIASAFLSQNATVIAKCDVNYKMRQYNALQLIRINRLKNSLMKQKSVSIIKTL